MQLHVTWVTVISHITHKIRREASQKSPKATHCEYVVKLFFRFSFCSAPSKRDRQVTTIIFRTMRQRHGRQVWLWVFRIWTTLMTLCKHKKVDWFFQKLLKLIKWCRLPSSADWITVFTRKQSADFFFFSPKNCGLHSSADYIRVRISFFFPLDQNRRYSLASFFN